jgi:hypothetical protein
MGSEKAWTLEEEIFYFLDHQPVGGLVTRFLIRDYLLETRALNFTVEEVDHAISRVEHLLGVSFPEGSLKEHIQRLSAEDIRTRLTMMNRFGANFLSKLDELTAGVSTEALN